MAFSERAMQGFRGALMEEVGGDVEVCGVNAARVTEWVRVLGAWLLGGLSRLIRICGMGRGLLVDAAITSGVNDRLPQRS
jgi:hypothetical protein